MLQPLNRVRSEAHRFAMPNKHLTVFHARLLVALACCVVAAGPGWAAPASSEAALNDPAAATLWPRVFYQADQRADIESRRRASNDEAASAPAILVYKLEGLAHGRKGATAWINGQEWRQGERHAGGRAVVIGRDGVRLRMQGQPDIVLRPGQQAAETGEVQEDIVPPGAVHKRRK